MPTEREVLMALTFDSTKAEQGMRKLADETAKVGAAAQKTQKEFNATAVAAERIGRARQEQQVRAELARQAPDLYGPNRPGARQLDQNADNSGALRFLRPLFAANAAISLGAGAARGAQDIAGQDLGLGRTIDSVASSAAEAIPILGSLATAFRQFGEVISGLAGERAGQSFLTDANAIQVGGLARAGALIRGGRARQDALRRTADDAAIDARTASLFAAGLTPNALASFRPRGMPGVADDATGGLRLAQARTEASARAAEERLAARRAELANAPERGELTRAQMDLEDAQGRVASGRGLARRATRELQQSGGFWGGFFGSPIGGIIGGTAEWTRNQNRQADVLAGQGFADRAQQEAQEAATRLEAAQAGIEKKREAVAQAESDAAKERLAAETAILDLRRNQLALVEREVEKSRAGAVASGMGGPGDTMQLRLALEQAQGSGFGSLTQRQKGLLAGDAETADFARQQAEALGRSDPERQRIRGLLGKQSYEVEEGSTAGMRDAIVQDEARANEQYKGTIASAMEQFRAEVTEAIADTMVRLLSNIRAEIWTRVQREFQDRAIGTNGGQ